MRMEAAEVMLRARVVRVTYEKGKTSLLYATSPDLKGLLVAERSREALDAAIPRAIMDLYAACGEHVVVTQLEGENQETDSWVAFPSEVAARALAEQQLLGH